MRSNSFKATLCGLTVLALATALGARAASPAAAPAAPPPAPAATIPTTALTPATMAPPPAANTNGPLIAGVCLLSQEGLIAKSKVGQATTARLRELTQQVQANLAAEKARIEARGKALEAKRATLSPMQIQAQGEALNQRAQALQAEAGERSQQIDATKAHAFDQVLQQAQPFITQAYAVHACGLLLAREAVVTGNLGNDLTPEVVAALDAKATPSAFDLLPPKAGKSAGPALKTSPPRGGDRSRGSRRCDAVGAGSNRRRQWPRCPTGRPGHAAPQDPALTSAGVRRRCRRR